MSFTLNSMWNLNRLFGQIHLVAVLASANLLLQTGFARAETYWVGVVPWQKGQTSDEIDRLYIPLLKLLSQKTGQTFKLKAMTSYEGTIAEITSGRIQLAMLSPAPYVKAKRENPKLAILVTELSWNADKTVKQDSYRSHILVRKDRADLTDLESLAGKSMGFVSVESTSGYLIPVAYLKSQKHSPEKFFSKVNKLGSHPAVTDAIAAGSVDAGATWDFNWQQAVKKNGDVFRSIWQSDPIPNLCIVAHPLISSALQKKLRSLLLEVPDDVLQGLSTVGYTVKADSFYDGIRKLSE